VALAENLEVAVGSDVDDRHLLLGDGLWGQESEQGEREEGCERDVRRGVQAQQANGQAGALAREESAGKQR
jgi:hypothetical protein